MLKILQVTKQFEYKIFGGVEYLVDNLCLNLNKYSIKSDVYTLRKKKTKRRNYKIFSNKEILDISSCPISINSFFNFSKISKNYDLINFHFPWPWMDLLSLTIPKKKIIVTYHADIIKKNLLYFIYFPLMMFFLKRANKILVHSKKYLDSSNVLKKFKNKVKVIPVGVKEIKFKKKLYLESKQEYFIFIGNFRQYKGLDFLIKVFVKNKLNLKIISSEKITLSIKNYIKKYKNIFLYEKISEKKKYQLIQDSVALILPSTDRREAYGIVLLEAASMKIPLISTEINSGPNFININNQTGLTFKPGNYKKADKCIKILKYNKKLRKTFGLNAFKRYKKLFTYEKMIKNYAKFYKQASEYNYF